MTKLKTLKDIQESARVKEGIIVYALTYDLRKEATKQAKKLYAKLVKISATNPCKYCKQHALNCDCFAETDATLQWITHFFNLTEKELNTKGP